MNACPPDRSRTAAEIVSYLSGHPDAADSIEGIARWWHENRKSELPAPFFKEVLSDLVTQGLVEAHRGANGAILYRVHLHRK